MTPKDKAEELVKKMQNIPSEETEIGKIHFLVMKQTAIRQALIAVNEIIDYLLSSKITGTLMTYWQEVKNEITSHKV